MIFCSIISIRIINTITTTMMIAVMVSVLFMMVIVMSAKKMVMMRVAREYMGRVWFASRDIQGASKE